MATLVNTFQKVAQKTGTEGVLRNSISFDIYVLVDVLDVVKPSFFVKGKFSL